MPKQADLYLASQSSRRRALLRQIGVNFEVVDIAIPEIKLPEETPAQYVVRLAQQKAQAGAKLVNKQPVLGADTIVVLKDRVMEKPRSAADAIDMLLSLSAQTHRVMTAVALAQSTRLESKLSITEVDFRQITVDEAEAYWRTGEPVDKAGAYGIQGLGAVFVKKITGSYSSVVGLPLLEASELLAKFEVPVWQR